MAGVARVRTFVRQVLPTMAPLGVLAFWLGMVLAARSYPSEYDWRYITISSLVYPERNPDGYLWARAGMVLCGLAGLYWTARAIRVGQAQRQAQAIAGRPAGSLALGLGYLCLASCALLPEWRLRTGKVHDSLALAAFLALCAGVVRSTFRAAQCSPRPRYWRRSPRLRATLLAAMPLAPIALAALAQAYVSHALPTLPWVNLSWRARGVPVYLSFAFWEWVTCALLSTYMVALSGVAASARHPPGSA